MVLERWRVSERPWGIGERGGVCDWRAWDDRCIL